MCVCVCSTYLFINSFIYALLCTWCSFIKKKQGTGFGKAGDVGPSSCFLKANHGPCVFHSNGCSRIDTATSHRKSLAQTRLKILRPAPSIVSSHVGFPTALSTSPPAPPGREASGPARSGTAPPSEKMDKMEARKKPANEQTDELN